MPAPANGLGCIHDKGHLGLKARSILLCRINRAYSPWTDMYTNVPGRWPGLV